MASVSTAATLACFLLLYAPYAEVGHCSKLMFIVPCLGYLTGKATAPASNCCLGVQNFYNAAGNTIESRKTACECFKDDAEGHHNLKPERVSDLPALCLRSKTPPFKISLDMDCSDIHQ